MAAVANSAVFREKAHALNTPDPLAVHGLMSGAGARSIRRGNFEFFRLRDPGEYVAENDRWIFASAFAAHTDMLCGANTQDYWASRPQYLDDLTDLWTVHLHRKLVGFSGLRVLHLAGEKILYIDTLNILPRALHYKFASYSLGAVLVHEMFIYYYLRFAEPIPFAFRTQNPHVYKLARLILPNGVHPPMGSHAPRQPERAAALAAAIAGRFARGKAFDPAASVIRGALGRSLYGERSSAMRPTDVVLARYFKEHVHVADGDALLVVAIPTAAEAIALAARYQLMVGRDVWRRMRASSAKTLAQPSRRRPEDSA